MKDKCNKTKSDWIYINIFKETLLHYENQEFTVLHLKWPLNYMVKPGCWGKEMKKESGRNTKETFKTPIRNY